MSGQIFLYTAGGRTLWVPRHTAAPHETKPVTMLPHVTPMELSRSFYLFDYPVQVVENAQMAATNPSAKTPNEVLAAVNDFRRVCAEDQSFLLQRCYNAPAQQQQQQQHQMPSQQQSYTPGSYSSSPPQPQHQHQQQQSMMPSGAAGGASGLDSTSLLTQLLHQQQRQQPQQGTMGGGNYGGGYGGNDRGDRRMPYGGGGVGGGNSGVQVGMGYPNNNMMMMPGGMSNQQPMMMGGGYGAMNAYGMDPMMMYGGAGGGMFPSQRGGRRLNNNMNPGNPMMMMGQPGMYGTGNRRGDMNRANAQQQQQSKMGGVMRSDPEPINLDGVVVPEEIKAVYMSPAQQLVIGTMPGPHMTVWLRELPYPTNLEDKKYVFGKKGVCLMLKAAFAEVKESKPVELFPKQICTHFFIYGYCSRPNCFHEHHTEEQLRELVAARHVQLKAMTKAQRHQLIDEIEQKEKEGIAAAEAHREKRRVEVAAEREARRMQRNPHGAGSSSSSLPLQPQTHNSAVTASPPNTQPNPSQDIGSDDEDDGGMLGGATGSQLSAKNTASMADLLLGASQEALPTGSNAAADTAASAAVAAKLGITDSDDEDGEEAGGDSNSASVSNANDEGAEAEAPGAKAGAEEPSEEEADEAEDEEEEEEAEEAEEEKAPKKKPAPKKRGRAAAPKKAVKKARK